MRTDCAQLLIVLDAMRADILFLTRKRIVLASFSPWPKSRPFLVLSQTRQTQTCLTPLCWKGNFFMYWTASFKPSQSPRIASNMGLPMGFFAPLKDQQLMMLLGQLVNV